MWLTKIGAMAFTFASDIGAEHLFPAAFWECKGRSCGHYDDNSVLIKLMLMAYLRAL